MCSKLVKMVLAAGVLSGCAAPRDWVTEPTDFATQPPCPLPGDVNFDGEFAFADFVAFSDNFGKPATWETGDFNGDGMFQFDDFVLASGYFGTGPWCISQPTGGFVTYMADERIWRIAAENHGARIDVSSQLDDMSPGRDRSVAVSKNGEWMALVTERFGCTDGCMVIARHDLSEIAPVEVDGEVASALGRPAVANDGQSIVFTSLDGPNELDLRLLRRDGDVWTDGGLLTGEGGAAYNDRPVLDPAGTHVLFDCGPTPYSQAGTELCEVAIEDRSVRVAAGLALKPGSPSATDLVTNGDYESDGSLVFEADWDGEHLYRLEPEADAPVLIRDRFRNDNVPCVLPNGYVASLWLDRQYGPGFHELKLMAPDGHEAAVLTPGLDIDGTGISCHAAPAD